MKKKEISIELTSKGSAEDTSNIFSEGELKEESNVSFFHIANSDKPVKYFSLDVIISVGYSSNRFVINYQIR